MKSAIFIILMSLMTHDVEVSSSRGPSVTSLVEALMFVTYMGVPSAMPRPLRCPMV